MSEIDFPVRGRGRVVVSVHAVLNAGRRRNALLIAVAGIALLAGGSGAAAQALTNTTPYTNAGPHVGDVVSNTSTITNNSPGYWTGAVQSNDGTITNNASAIWDGAIVANSSTHDIVNNGIWLNGTVTLNGGNITNNVGANWTGDSLNNLGLVFNYGTWTGDVTGNSIGGVTNSGADALWTGDVVANDSQLKNQGGATWKGDVAGNNNIIFNMNGSTWRGDVLANGGGSNTLTQIDNRGDWYGDIMTNAEDIFNEYGKWTGDVYDNTGAIGNGYYNPADWFGDVLNNHGRILNNATSTWTGDVIANAGDIANYGAWNGNLTTSGRIIHTGVWTGNVVNNGTFFWAQNQINGSFDNRGALQLTGDLSGITTLTNSGALEFIHDSGMQTLSAGSLVLTPSSSYQLDVTAAGASDRIVVGGAATLDGTVTIAASTTGGPYASPTNYTILTAGSINGSFAGVTTDLAFFAPHLSYDGTTVTLTLKRNDLGLPDIGITANQRSVGATVNALGAGNPLYDAALWLTPGQAQQAFNELSGEAHSSMQSWFVENAGLLANLVTGRVDQAFDALGDGDGPSSYFDGPLPPSPRKDTSVWGQVYGAHASLAGNGNAAGLDASTGGFAGGFDGLLGDWRLGFMMQAGATGSAIPALNQSSRSTDYGLGAYGGTQWGATRLSLGATYTRHDIRSTRDVAFPGFADTLTASYAAGTAQIFGKLSHEFDLGAVSLIPYASLAHVRQDTDGFVEAGGPAALSAAPSALDATFTTLGTSVDRSFVFGNGMLVTAKASLGWRHAFADAPAATYALAGGTSFSAVGAPVASDTIVLGAGLNLDINADNTLDLAYDGQIGSGTQTHIVKATWGARF